MFGGNLAPWGGYWPDSRYDGLLSDAGMNLMRVGHGEKFYVDMEAWYPTRGGTPDWDAPGVLGAGKTFNDQIAWWKAMDMPVMYTLNDELSTAMLKSDGTLDYAEVARAWSLHIKHLIDSGVDVRYVEIGNECDIAPMEGIEYPPVEQSRGGRAGTGRFIDPRVEPASSNEYIKLWNAVYPAIKAVAPNVKVSAYPSGQGPGTSPYFPYDHLFTVSPYKPDFFPIHCYSFAASSTPAQRVVDSTWAYSGKFFNDWESSARTVKDTLAAWGAGGTEVGITEFNYDGAGQYTSANQMWDAVYYASVIANAANGGLRHTVFWDTFAGSNTDELVSDIYTDPTPELRSQALAMRLLKQFDTAGRVVLPSSVSSSDDAVPYDWQGQPMSVSGLAGKRVESLATRDAAGTKVLLINKNVTAAHDVAVTVQGVSGAATLEVYDGRADLAAGAPTRTGVTIPASGSIDVHLPPLSLAVLTTNGSTTPPPPPDDTTAPAVAITAPASGAVLSGSTAISALASDAGSGVSRVEFRVDGQLVGTDTSAPYSVTWDASAAAEGSHLIEASAVDGAGNVGKATVTVSVVHADTTAPTVAITAPAEGAAVSGTVAITAAASDAGSGVERVEFRVDGQLVGSDSTAPYSASWEVPAVAAAAPVSGPVVSFSFDDTNLSQYTSYAPILRAAGYPATLFVNTDEVGQGGKLTLAQLRELRDAGWEVSSHTADHWNSLPANPTAADYEAPVAEAKAWLDANGFPDSGFASPNGTNNDLVRQVVAKYHPYNRTSWGTAPLPPEDPYELHASPIDYTELDYMSGELDAIEADDGWAIFLSHGWESPTKFQQLVNEVKARGIEVRTVRDVMSGAAATGHTIEAVAIDKAGNRATDSIRVEGSGSTTPPPPPDDTTAPVLSAPVLLSADVRAGWMPRVRLTWIDTSDGEDGFIIERTGATSLAWTVVGMTGAGGTSFTQRVRPGSYLYRIRAYADDTGGRVYSPYSASLAVDAASRLK